MKRDLTRREFLEASGVGAAVMLGIGACEGDAPGPGVPGDASVRLDATPECVETEDNVLGPAYLPGAPMRTDLNVLGWAGVSLMIAGTVRGTGCEPVPGALIDVWQADDAGCYDGSSIDACGAVGPLLEWPLRGQMVADAQGRYQAFHAAWTKAQRSFGAPALVMAVDRLCSPVLPRGQAQVRLDSV